MSPNLPYAELRTASFPRVSGDEPLNMPGTPGSPPFSPRERG